MSATMHPGQKATLCPAFNLEFLRLRPHHNQIDVAAPRTFELAPSLSVTQIPGEN